MNVALIASLFAGISMQELYPAYQHLQTDELIVDVRTPAEFADGHVPDARNIPHIEAADRVDELRAYRRVYVYCQSGRRTQIAASIWKRAGLDNLIVVEKSGMPQWIEAGYPVEK